MLDELLDENLRTGGSDTHTFAPSDLPYRQYKVSPYVVLRCCRLTEKLVSPFCELCDKSLGATFLSCVNGVACRHVRYTTPGCRSTRKCAFFQAAHAAENAADAVFSHTVQPDDLLLLHCQGSMLTR